MTEQTATRDFGRYRLERLISRGGMGEIYLAQMEGAAGFVKKVVIKKILPHLAQQPEFVTRFIDEAHIVVSLTHGNIVPVLDMGEVNGEYYIAMEYISGRDLGDVLGCYRRRGEHMPLHLGAFVIGETCRALEYAHQKTDETGASLKIVHRDVSPSNILLSREGVVKLTDFGIAKAVSKLGHSITGQLQGKFCYMSPEQASGETLDYRSDIFSLGTVAYEVFTGVRPFEGSTDLNTLGRVKRAHTVPPTELVADLPKALDKVLMQALARTPGDRYASVRDFGAALLQTADPEGKGNSASLAQELGRLFPSGIVAHTTPPAGMGLDEILALEADRILMASPSGRSPTLTAPSRVDPEGPGNEIRPTPPSIPLQLLTPDELARITGLRQSRPRMLRSMVVAAVLFCLAAVLLWIEPGYLRATHLDLTCSHPGAQILVDNAARGICPVVLDVTPGQHQIAATRGEMSGSQTVLARRGRTTPIELVLSSAPVDLISVTVHTEPAGEFAVDEPEVWYPSSTRIEVQPGRHDIWARAEGHAPEARYQVPFSRENAEAVIRLLPLAVEESQSPLQDAGQTETVLDAGPESVDAAESQVVRAERVRLDVTVQPSEAWILDGDRRLRQGSATLRLRADDAPRRIRAVLDGYEPQERLFEPSTGSAQIRFELVEQNRQRFPVRIVAHPYLVSGAPCTIAIDGVEQQERGAVTVELGQGPHEVSVECSEPLRQETRTIAVQGGSETQTEIFLRPVNP